MSESSRAQREAAQRTAARIQAAQQRATERTRLALGRLIQTQRRNR